ncbi:MAG: endonuclease [Bacteroidaceae bacterium]|nr:endonuclease [Bacteroidaceae bacterium]
MRFKHFMQFVALFVSSSLWAQIPSGYYDRAAGKTGQELRAALHEIIKGHTVVSYDGLKAAYFYTDAYPDGKLWDIYSNYHWTSGEVCGNYGGEGDCWNREHTWPQSWFGSGTPKSDLFHVLPTDGYVNNRRSSYPFGEVGSASYTSGNGSKLGTCKTSGYSGTVFEPIDEYKGDIARGFFYMSTRYYTEDSGWDSSKMTTKCEIKEWALKMLLRWHKQDPVSQKEIDRNNVIYASYQHNRNPFIDHPEYAEMIWDENWQEATTYNITSATNLSGGTVSAPYSAPEGTTVAITATPKAGYIITGYSAWKTGDTSTPVTVSSNGTFTMPGYPVTVSATFERDATQYTITLSSTTNGTISASATSALSGTPITLTPTPAEGYVLQAVYVYKTGDISTVVTVTDNAFVMPSYNVTVSATFVEEGSAGGTGDFVKVTSEPTDWSGEYLIVYEGGKVAFNGSINNNWGLCSGVNISNGTIEANATTNGYAVTISPSGSGYKILLPSGNYMNWIGEKKFSEGTSATSYSISFSGGNVNISNGGYVLKYNSAGGLRSYSSTSNLQPIQLYKRSTPAAPAVMHTITFQNNDGSFYTQEVEEFKPTALIPNTFTREGYEFDGWLDDDRNFYADGATVTLLDDITLYPLWNELFDITLVQPAHGTISASATTATEDLTIELTATPDEGYQLHHWTVTAEAGETVEVFDDRFTMPASDVTVTATFVAVAPSGEAYYELVTSASQLQAGKTYLIVNTAASKALSKTQNANNRAAANVDIADGIIKQPGDACELTLGGSAGAWTFYDSAKSGYLYAASSSSNYLRTQTTNDANGTWSITIASDGTATIKAQGSNSRNLLRYNNSASNGNLFSCYASGQQAVSLFLRVEPPAVIIGDVNDDKAITIADVTALVNIILGKDDQQLYNHDAADVNDDGTITIADVTALVNLILGKTD